MRHFAFLFAALAVMCRAQIGDLTSSQRCTLCLSFADALITAVENNTPGNQLMTESVNGCQMNAMRFPGVNLGSYCREFYDSYFTTIHQGVQAPETTPFQICHFLCHSQQAQAQDDNSRLPQGWREPAPYVPAPADPYSMENANDIANSQDTDQCLTCKDVARNVIDTLPLFMDWTSPSPESVCVEIQKCPPPTVPPAIMEKLTQYWYELNH